MPTYSRYSVGALFSLDKKQAKQNGGFMIRGDMRKPRKATPNHLRKEVFERDGYRCRYCGSDQGPFHADHVYPVSKGGETTANNLVTACRHCNGRKYDRVGMWPNPLGFYEIETPVKPRPRQKSLTSFFLFILGFAVIYVVPMTFKTAFSVIEGRPTSPAPEVFYVSILVGAIPIFAGLVLKIRGGQA